MTKRTFLIVVLAAVAIGAGPKQTPMVYVPVFRSQSLRPRENLAMTELVIKEIERRTAYKVVGTWDEADILLDGSYSADANGEEKLTVEWTNKRTKATVSTRSTLKNSEIKTLAEYVVDGMKLLK